MLPYQKLFTENRKSFIRSNIKEIYKYNQVDRHVILPKTNRLQYEKQTWKPVYNGPSVALRSFVCAVAALFLSTFNDLVVLYLHRTDVF